MNDIKNICVYCASSTQADPAYVEAARRLGTLMAARGIGLVNGAGRMGLMAVTADAVLQGGGRATGVIPRFMVERGWQHTGMTRLIEVDSMHERKCTMAGLSDAVIALPGGCGTLEELLEIITWKQLGLYTGPIVILNVSGYYDPLLAMMGRAVEQRLMRPCHAALWTVASTPEEALRQVVETPRWDATVSKFAAL